MNGETPNISDHGDYTFEFSKNDLGELCLKVYNFNEEYQGCINVPEEYDGKPVTEVRILPGHACLQCGINIPKGVKAVDFSCSDIFDNFMYCTIRIDPDNPYLCFEKKILFSKDKKRLIQSLDFKHRYIDIPRGVERIESHAFMDHMGLERVTLPPETRFIDSMAFYYCLNLEKVNLKNVKELAPTAFESCSQLDNIRLTCPKVNGFPGCSSLKSVTLENTKSIGEFAFSDCRSLTEIKLPEGLETIGENAFSGCGIKRLSLPKSVRSVGSMNGTGLEEIELYQASPFPLAPKEGIALPFGCRITVRSSETDEVVLSLVNFRHETERDFLKKEFNITYISAKGVDFAKYDKKFSRFAPGRERPADELYVGYQAALCRLEYPIDLTEEMRSVYKQYTAEHAAKVLRYLVAEKGIDEINKFKNFGDISDNDFSEIIKLAVERNEPELTALILQKRHGHTGRKS